MSGINYKGEPDYFLQSGMLNDQAPLDNEHVDIILDDVSVAERGGEIEFYFKTDSEPGADKLRFFIDGREQVTNAFPASGKIDWQIARFAFPALQGNEKHKFRWSYQKDSTMTVGQDVGYIDQITVFGIIGAE